MDSDSREALSPTPGCPGLGLIPVPSLTPETPTWPVGRRYLSDSLEFTPLEDTRQITFVDISITPEAGNPSLPDSSLATCTGVGTTPVQLLTFSPGSEASASPACRDLLGDTFWVNGSCGDAQKGANIQTPAAVPATRDANCTFSLCSFVKKDGSTPTDNVKQPSLAPDDPSWMCSDISPGISSRGNDAATVPTQVDKSSHVDTSDFSFPSSLNCTVLQCLNPATKEPIDVALPLEELPAVPSSIPLGLPLKTLAEATFSKPDNGGEALCDSGNLDVAVALDGTFSVSFTTSEVAPQLPAMEACENSAIEDVGVPAESGATFMASPAPAVDRPKLEQTRAMAPAHFLNSSLTVSHNIVEEASGSSHPNEAACKGGGTEDEAGCPAARECQDGFTEEADLEAERRISFTVPSASATEELEKGGPAGEDVGAALVGAGRVCGTAISDATFIESLETRGTVASRLVADVRASASPLGPQQSRPTAEDNGTVPVVADEVGDAVVSDATFTEPSKVSGIVAGRPVAGAKADAASGVPAPPLGSQRSLPAPRLRTKLQPGKGQPAGVVPAKRGTGISGRQSLLPTGGAAKTAGRGLQRKSLAVPSQRPLRPLQQTLPSRQRQAPSADAPAAGATSASSTATHAVPATHVQQRVLARPTATQRLAFRPAIQPPGSLLPRVAAAPTQSRLVPVRATGAATTRRSMVPPPSRGQRVLGGLPPAAAPTPPPSVVRASTPLGLRRPPSPSDVNLPTPITKM
ncbi:uncharacterized protein LOC115321122 [Ixodes scapularis]|uniref:uncharacterized protein LOC115321122 n=1 Tax=Ixodes scapularis TaxID=6945 RepID=UPI001AD66228|nr:uncharacterized protein LOC115321122 [Ixodes scapularis]